MVLSYFSKTNIAIRANLIVGLPGETKETIEETIRYLRKLYWRFNVSPWDSGIAAIYPGTKLYNEMLLANKLNMDIEEILCRDRPLFYTMEHTEKALFKLHSKLLKSLDFPWWKKSLKFLYCHISRTKN